MESTATNAEIEQVNNLTTKGLYLDAKTLAESTWGPISEWQSPSQVIIAIRLMYHLGGDRLSDALLLKQYRKAPLESEFLERMLYYRLNKKGLILAQEFAQEITPLLEKSGDKQAEFLAFKSIMSRELKDFSQAEMYLQAAVDAKPEDKWIPSLKVRLLLDQERDGDALKCANHLFGSNPSVLNLRLVMSVVQKQSGLKAATEILKKHIEQFQSCSLWLQLASMCATELDWDGCEYAIQHFLALRQFHDKYDEQQLLAHRGQIHLHKGEYETAKQILEKHKGGYWKAVCKNIASAPENAKTKVLDVPFYRQEHLTCAPTTMAAVANYWGKRVESNTIAEQICYSGTPDTKERQWLRENGFCFVEFDLKHQDVFSLIDLGIPFCLVTTSGFSSHLQAVIGYNEHVGTMYIMDPSFSGMQEMLIEGCIKDEAYHGPRCMAFVPEDQKALLDQFSSEDIDVYEVWDTYLLARELNDSATTKSNLDKLQSLAPKHRLTAKAQRDYALSMADYASVLAFNESLIKEFPTETTLLNSEFLCLRDLGRRAEGIKRLENFTSKHFDLDLCATLFDQIGGTTEQHDLQLELLQKLKRFGSYQAEIHSSLAHYYWGNDLREKATQHYLYAYCLDETNNTFIENYFKACRYLGQEDKAVSFIEQRFAKYSDRSPAPAIALFRVFELQSEDHRGIDVLEQALIKHPKDIELINILASALITHGQFEKLAEHDPVFRAALSADDYAALQAEIAVKKGKLSEALEFYEFEFNQRPFIVKSAQNYFSLLYRLQREDTLDAALEALYEANPSNAYACDYLIQWHSNEKLQRDVLISSVKARKTDGDLRRKLIDKHIRLGEKEQALKLAQETFELLPNEEINEAYIAKALNVNGKFDDAAIHARAALRKAIDNDTAFSQLFIACKNNAERQDALQFVLSQISEQAVFGDSLWNYWFEAKNLVSKEEQQAFIDLLLSKHAHLWFTYCICSFFHKQHGDLEQAIHYLNIGIDKFPFTPRLHKELGHIYELVGRDEEAIDAYLLAMQLSPGWSEVAKLLVDLYEKKSEKQKAISVLNTTLIHTPDDGILHGYIADLYFSEGDIQKSIEHLIKAVEYQAEYPWAWRKLKELGEETNKPNLAYDTAQTLVEKYPHNSQMWCNLAEVSDSRDEKYAQIRKALAVNPLNQNAYIALVNYYIDSSDYQKALAVFSDTPWGEDLPFDLVTNQANMFAQIGQFESAVNSLKEVLYTQAGYGNLWRSYYDWLFRIGDPTKVAKAAHKQIEINKHDPTSLCYGSEILLKAGSEDDQRFAKEQLIRAFHLAPNDQYIVLTLADLYLDEKQYAEALEVLRNFEVFAKTAFGTARQIICLSELDKADEAKALFEYLLDMKDADYWCISKSFDSLSRKIAFDSCLAIFEQRFTSINELQAYIWADSIVSAGVSKPAANSKKTKGSTANRYKNILPLIQDQANDALKDGVIRAIFESWNDHGIKPNYKVIDDFKASILRSPPVFEQVSMLLLNRLQFKQLIALFDQFSEPNQLTMYCYYQVRCAYQMLERWDEASSAIEAGIAQAPDTVVHNMRLWYLYEIWRNGSIFDESELDVIDYHELIEVERYVFSTLKVAVHLGSDSLEDSLERITPYLRKCQEDNQEVSGNYLATCAQKLLRERLKQRISSQGFFANMLMKWKLSNRF